MIPEGIDNKYEVIRVLHESAATAVILVNYKTIGALRILKAIHKAHPDANSILSEAYLLQGFKSSQIPTIYDVEETTEMFYLVEEYVEGISLREYLLKTKLTKEKLIEISIEICKIMEDLHSAGPEPVLYRDLKPEHVILQNNSIKLIDFGISIKKSNAETAAPLGTIDWASPEQLAGASLDERSDIYSIGKLIGFMQASSYAKDDFRIKQIVSKATEKEPDDRIQSAAELRSLLERIRGDRVNDKIGKQHLEKKIAIVGASNAVGTTRIAISLCKFFNKQGIECYYKDVEGCIVQKLWLTLKNTNLQKGVLYHEDFRGVLDYGEAVKTYIPPRGLYIFDCGCNTKVPLGTDLIIYVTSGAPWQQPSAYPDWIRDKNVYVISNLSDVITSASLAKELNKRVYRYPSIKGFGLTKDEEKLFIAILKNEKDFIISKKAKMG